MQNLFVSDGSRRPDGPAEARGRFHAVCPQRQGLRQFVPERLGHAEEYVCEDAPNTEMYRCFTLCYASGDINALRTILLYHINNGIFIGGGLETGVTNLLKSSQGSNIRVVNVSMPWERQTFIQNKKKLNLS